MDENKNNNTAKKESHAFAEMYGRYLDVSGVDHKILDISYGDNERNCLDLYYPNEDKDRYPLIIFFHGGAFIKGDKRRYQLKPALTGINRGYAVASINYRLVQQAAYPAFKEDAIRAVRYLKAHATELQLDVDHICIWGESAGAYLAMVTAFVEEAQVLIDWYGYADFDQVAFANQEANEFTQIVNTATTLNEATFRCKGDELKAVMREAVATNYLKEKIPATFIEHGTADQLVPIQQSKDLYELLTGKIGVERCQLRLVEGGTHGVEGYSDEENLNLIYRFIDQWI